MHARNVYLVLNLSTGCVSPQYHCCFDNFFETTRHDALDVSDTITWQQLVGLGRASKILSQISAPILHGPNYGLSHSDSDVHPDDSSIILEESDVNWDAHSNASKDTNGETQVTENIDVIQAEGDTTTAAPISAGTSLRGRARTMSRRMADSVSQRDFYGTKNMHYMAQRSIIGETPDDLYHDAHLELQECIKNLIAFHAKMIGDIMNLQQALRQHDAKQFVDAVVKEVNGHVENGHWELVPQDTVPKDAQIVPSVWVMQRKCNLTTNNVKGHKARLDLHGGRQIYGMNYF
jgi:hypothetical protein